MRAEHFSPFEYLAQAASKALVDGWNSLDSRETARLWKTSTPDQRRLLTEAAAEIEKRADAKPLSDWIEGFEPDKRVFKAKRMVFLLIVVLEELANAGIEPFKPGAYYYLEEEDPRDWSKLPLNLAFLVEDAKKYGECWIEESAEAALKEMSAEERDRLAALHETLERNAHLEHLLAKYPPGNEYPESQDIDGLLSIAHAAWLDKRGQSLFSP